MKKITLLLILFLGLVGCETSTDDPNDQDTDGIHGVEDMTINVGDRFDPMAGITATNDCGEDITAAIDILGLNQLHVIDGIVLEPGTFVIVYEAADYSAIRVITVNTTQSQNLSACGNQSHGEYVITWWDEFSGEGANLNAYGVNLDNWSFQTGTGTEHGLTGWGNDEAQYYREENARVEDGRLIIEARRESYGGMQYTSARLWTKPTFQQTYGRFEASIKLPVGAGLWPAYWMMPQDDVYGGWAASGEIDIMEAKGRSPHQSIGALHFGGSCPNNTHTHAVYHFPSGQSIADFNLYAIEWEAGEIRWYVNDVLIKTSTTWHTEGHAFPAPFDQDFYLLLNLAIGGTFDGGVLPPDALFNDPVLMEIEYVRVYQKDE